MKELFDVAVSYDNFTSKLRERESERKRERERERERENMSKNVHHLVTFHEMVWFGLFGFTAYQPL